MRDKYGEFLLKKSQWYGDNGFSPIWMPDFLKDFQAHFVEKTLRKGRMAVFSDCGTGKTPVNLVWSENVVRKTNKRVLIATPLSVCNQFIEEGKKFGVRVKRSKDGKPKGQITITNYERLHLFNRNDYVGFAGDEASIMKNFDGKTKKTVTQFIRKMPYRIMLTATAAPNDYPEFGTISEALGYMGYVDMTGKFFKNIQGSCDTRIKAYLNKFGTKPKWLFLPHAEEHFWRWVCSWAIAMRTPSDLGFSDDGFILPELTENEHVIEFSRPMPGKLFVEPAVGRSEQLKERRYTINERCEKVAELVGHDDFSVSWCHLNDEADLLEKMIPDSCQIHGRMGDDQKEELFDAFSKGQLKKLIIKPKIGAFGLNWQHCNHTTFFPSHSYEQYYQGVRRFWRFFQEREVTVDIVTTAGELSVLKNLKRKAQQSQKSFQRLVKYINDPENITIGREFSKKTELPSWL